jgi:hypothetical protein
MVNAMRVTFDTNTIDRAVRPERFPKDSRPNEYIRVRDALADGRIRGYIRDTLFTLEGMEKVDRAEVYGGTTLVSSRSQTTVQTADGPQTAIQINMKVHQPGRKALHPELARRIRSALRATPLKVAKGGHFFN